MINLVLFGPPGSGKGTQSAYIVKHFGLKQISTGDLFRYNISNATELGMLAKSYMDKGELAPDQVTIDMLRAELRKPIDCKGFIFDGFPRTLVQAAVLDEMIDEELGEDISICLALRVPDEILTERLLERGKTSERPDDKNPDIIQKRIQEYYAKTAEVATHYQKQGKYVEINGIGSVEEIAHQISEAIKQHIRL